MAPWHFLYFLPLPHGHGAFLGTLSLTAWVAVAVPRPPPDERWPPACSTSVAIVVQPGGLGSLLAGLLLVLLHELDPVDVAHEVGLDRHR